MKRPSKKSQKSPIKYHPYSIKVHPVATKDGSGILPLRMLDLAIAVGDLHTMAGIEPGKVTRDEVLGAIRAYANLIPEMGQKYTTLLYAKDLEFTSAKGTKIKIQVNDDDWSIWVGTARLLFPEVDPDSL